MLKLLTTLLAIITLIALAGSAHADESDRAVVQDATSATVVTGNSNRSTHLTDQTVRQQGRRSSDISVIQQIHQTEDTYGHGNSTLIRSRQDVDTRSRSSQ